MHMHMHMRMHMHMHMRMRMHLRIHMRIHMQCRCSADRVQDGVTCLYGCSGPYATILRYYTTLLYYATILRYYTTLLYYATIRCMACLRLVELLVVAIAHLQVPQRRVVRLGR
jgi:hypothetical protein